MAEIGSVSATARSALQQLNIQNARRAADQAEREAQTLSRQAELARSRAAREEQNADSLSARAKQADGVAIQARQGLAAVTSAAESTDRLTNALSQVNTRSDPAPVSSANAPTVTTAAPASTTTAPPQPVVNTQGQRIGTIINTTA